MSVEQDIIAIVRELNRSGRHGGLVPISEIRGAAKGHLSRSEVDALLLEMERKFILDLKIANDPRALSDGGASGIPRGQTVAYWVVVR